MYNPLAQATARLTWRDLNGDDIAQGRTRVRVSDGGLRDQPRADAGELRRPARCAPTTRRPTAPYNVISNIGIQHQLLPRLSV